MPTWEKAEELISSESAQFTSSLISAASRNPTEATFRDKLMPILAEFCKKAGVAFDPKGGYSLVSGGKPDTVFNRLIIEYKAPGKLGQHNSLLANSDAIDQLRGYMRDVAHETHTPTEKLAGVVLDGKHLIFVHKSEEDAPVQVTPESVSRLLRYLIYLEHGVALNADNLVGDFGIDQPPAKAMIAALEQALINNTSPIVPKLFQQWRTFFSEVIEYKEAFSETKLRELKKFAARAGIDISTDEDAAERFFFSIHTYFVFLVKLLAWLALYRHIGLKIGIPSFGNLATMSSGDLHREMKRMEDGDLFREFAKIANLLEGDFFRWYVYAWTPGIERALREVLVRLDNYDPTTLELNPDLTRDLLKKLYSRLMPKEIRHNLGEYYTPDWLAQMLLNQLDNSFFTDKESDYLRKNLLKLRFLDPACGSGTFLVLTIKRIRDTGRRLLIPEREILQAILSNVAGFDLNPMAVIAARTNYLLALGSLIEQPHGLINIPVYMADSIIPPLKGTHLGRHRVYAAETAVKTFDIPEEVVKPEEKMNRFCTLLEECVRDGVDPEVFMKRAEGSLELDPQDFQKASPNLLNTYQSLLDLHNNKMDGIWTRIIKNAFAPWFVRPYDYVVGNPPWINWESLPDGYRNKSKSLWQEHGLFRARGMDTILGKGKKDISMLMTYVAADHYLKDGGRLGFLITQSVFKTGGAGQGFRRFILGDSTPLKVIQVEDLTELQPFEGATNRTAILILQKNQETTYPVPYNYWKKTAKGAIGFDSTLREVLEKVKIKHFDAEYVDAEDRTSAWLTGRRHALKAAKKTLGKSDYEAHAGAYTGGANGVYWLNVEGKNSDGDLLVQNFTEGQKTKIQETTAVLEPDLVYPLLRGRDVDRWKAHPSAWILMVQDPETRSGIDEKTLQEKYRKTWSYLKQFETVLRRRGSRGISDMLKKGASFYTMFAISDYTYAPYKVVWKEQASSLTASVIGSYESLVIIPDHKLMLVACRTNQEAHYLCAMLNSNITIFVARCYAIETQIDTHIVDNVRIPRFDSNQKIHTELSRLSQLAHNAAMTNDTLKLKNLQQQIDKLAGEVWSLSSEELREIQTSLAELD